MLNELIVTYKQLSIFIASLALIVTFVQLTLTYWKHYVKLMRIINWVRFILVCISFFILIYVCIIF